MTFRHKPSSRKRQALNEVVTDHRFLMRKTFTPLDVEYIVEQAASGERDLNRLKSSAEKLANWLPARERTSELGLVKQLNSGG